MLIDKYRPKDLDEIVGQEDIISSIKEQIAKSKNDPKYKMPHYLFVGGSGTGKTTTAICMARELFDEDWERSFIELNASDERGIETVRTRIKPIAYTMGRRILFLDECDNMTDEAQGALRRMMERTQNTIFILSCNKLYKIIEPIRSRCVIKTFKRLSDMVVLKKLLEVSKAEGMPITPENKDAFMLLAQQSHGDLRRALNDLEDMSGKNGVNKRSVMDLSSTSLFVESMKIAVGGDFERAKDMLEDGYINAKFSTEVVIDGLFKAISTLGGNAAIKPKLFVKLAETEYRLRFGCDPLVQLVNFIAWAWVIPHTEISKDGGVIDEHPAESIAVQS
jgi:replication factor C small subunit